MSARLLLVKGEKVEDFLANSHAVGYSVPPLSGLLNTDRRETYASVARNSRPRLTFYINHPLTLLTKEGSRTKIPLYGKEGIQVVATGQS